MPAGAQQKFADYLASINLSETPKHPFELKSFPRPSGRATKVVITEYDLPRKEIQPHDVIVDPDGMIWYSHFGEQFLSRLDPRTGKVTDFSIPVQKPGYPMGTLDLELDADGYIWVGLMYQTGMARSDRATETSHLPILANGSRPQQPVLVAATKWTGKRGSRTQTAPDHAPRSWSGEYENLGSFRNPKNQQPIGIYGIYADQENNVYILEFPFGGIGRIDAKTGKLAFYETPTPNARARRGRVDHENRLWFAEYGGNAVAMFDPKPEKIAEWEDAASVGSAL